MLDATLTASPSTVLIALAILFLVYFGPPILRVVLKPEHGSKLDLRIAWFETFVNDVEKRTTITAKLLSLAKLPAPPPVPDSERTTVPPAAPSGPATPEKENDHV